MSDDVFGQDGDFISWKDAPKGTEYKITITKDPEVVDGTDFNGEPEKQIWIRGTVDDEDRTLTMPKRSHLARTIGQALGAAGSHMTVGGVLTVRTLGLLPSPKDPKRTYRAFEAVWQAGNPFTDDEPPF